MSDQFTEVTSKSWGSRLMDSIKGVLVGLLLFVVAFPVLFWNEGRAVQTYKSLSEGRGATVAADAAKPDAGNEGKLVHVSGLATTDQVLADPALGIKVPAIRLKREVQMYQWVEEKKEETKKKLGGGEEKVTTYAYSKAWKAEREDSSQFRESEGHENPDMELSSDSWQASNVTLGAMSLSEGLVKQMSNSEKLPVDEAMLASAKEATEVDSLVVTGDGGLYVGGDPEAPEIGDLRISFSRVMPAQVSVVARQAGTGLTGYQTKAGDVLEMLSMGTVAVDEMFKQAESANATMTWILRLVGLVIMFIGLALVFKPISVLGDVVPIVGSILAAGTGLAAFLIALPLSILTIAVAWLFYRPVLGVALLVVSVGLLVGARMIAARRKPAAASAAARAA